MPSAHLHQLVLTPRLAQRRDLRGERVRLVGVTELIDEPHVRTLLSFDPGFGQRLEFVGVGLADALQELQRRRRLFLVDLGQGEADMNQHPLTGLGRVVGEQADVDHPPDAAHVHPGQVRLIGETLNYLTGYAKAHVTPFQRSVVTPATRSVTILTASSTAAATGSLSPMPGSVLAGSQPTTSTRPVCAPSMSST